jgi:alpha-glucoside transport system permease protein
MKNRRVSISRILLYALLALIAALWTVPTLGLLVSSFRPGDLVLSSGWWTVLQDPGHANLTLDNYRIVLSNGDDPSLQAIMQSSEQNINLLEAVINSLTVAIPATAIPILLAAFAAYGFAWIRFPGRKTLFMLVIAIQVVPLQTAFIPVLRDFIQLKLNGTWLGIWLAHTGFGLPLAILILYAYISSIPKEMLEAAFIDGASHFTIFRVLILPLSIPALASFAILQFLWVWNDLLVALIFLGPMPQVQVLTQRILALVGTYGNRWYLLTAGGFISMILPLVVYFTLQRYLVRGLLAGSVKG